MKKLQKLYQRTSKQTQNRLQEIFDVFQINFSNLYNIADNKTKKRVNTYIEEWQDKDLLKGYFGSLAKNIYSRTRVKNNEILELLIYGAYIEEQNKLEKQELDIIKENVNYYYKQGQEEVNKTLNKKKKVSLISDALFLYLLSLPMSIGLNWKQYIDINLRYNTEQIYRQAVIDMSQGKELKIDSDVFQGIANKQLNAKLSINGDKYSGIVENFSIGINNNAKIEGIKSFDENAKVVFIAVEDNVTTKMCKSLDGQIFNVHDWNEFKRYSKNSDCVREYKCYGLVTGLNLPPINDGFHWCRSTIQYCI